jgi:hypothetical protein
LLEKEEVKTEVQCNAGEGSTLSWFFVERERDGPEREKSVKRQDMKRKTPQERDNTRERVRQIQRLLCEKERARE